MAQGEANGTLCIYELDSNGEAIAVRWFCSEKCLSRHSKPLRFKRGVNNDWIPGTVCDECGAQIEAGERTI